MPLPPVMPPLGLKKELPPPVKSSRPPRKTFTGPAVPFHWPKKPRDQRTPSPKRMPVGIRKSLLDPAERATSPPTIVDQLEPLCRHRPASPVSSDGACCINESVS